MSFAASIGMLPLRLFVLGAGKRLPRAFLILFAAQQ